MPGRSSQLEQLAAISRIAQVGSQADAFREHLTKIMGSAAFKGSRRSQEFLQHIVEKALHGCFDELKERALGTELFGRPAAYDTGEDAIVRVTASDVRRRLLHFYAASGLESELRIDLPSGSYIPEFRQISSAVSAEPESIPESPATEARQRPRLLNLMYFAMGGLVVFMFLSLWNGRTFAHNRPADDLGLWSAMFRPDRQLRLVFCDPDVSKVQGLLDFRISVSDYANHQYLPPSLTIGSEMQRAILPMRGVNVASVDATIALNIAELALKNARRLKTHTARSMQLTDFKTDDNFILLGSPRSNPWFALFEDDLDFKFEYDPALRQEIIRNTRVQTGEAERYIPTAQGWDTGQAYAIVAFVGNPGQSGRALVLAGSNAEATEAAGKLVTNLDLLSRVLKDHGIDPAGPPLPFEVLLRVASMAGSSKTFDVIAFHSLSNMP
jgi:hypothetical protein